MAEEFINDFCEISDSIYEGFKSFSTNKENHDRAKDELDEIRHKIKLIREKILIVDRNIEIQKIKMFDSVGALLFRRMAPVSVEDLQVAIEKHRETAPMLEEILACERQKLELLTNIEELQDLADGAWSNYSAACAEKEAALRACTIACRGMLRLREKAYRLGWEIDDCAMFTLADVVGRGCDPGCDCFTEDPACYIYSGADTPCCYWASRLRFHIFNEADLDRVDDWEDRLDRAGVNNLEPDYAAIERELRAIFIEAGLQIGSSKYAEEIKTEIEAVTDYREEFEDRFLPVREAVVRLFGRLRAKEAFGFGTANAEERAKVLAERSK